MRAANSSQLGAEGAARGRFILRQPLKVRSGAKEMLPERAAQRRLQHPIHAFALAAGKAGEGAQPCGQQRFDLFAQAPCEHGGRAAGPHCNDDR